MCCRTGRQGRGGASGGGGPYPEPGGRGKAEGAGVLGPTGLPSPMRILVVKLSSLGDLFHALPAVHNLKVGLGAEVDSVTRPECAGLVRCFGDPRRPLPQDEGWQVKSTMTRCQRRCAWNALEIVSPGLMLRVLPQLLRTSGTGPNRCTQSTLCQ